MESIVPLEVGYSPEAAVSGAMLLQSEHSTFLLFNAMEARDGAYVDAGYAVAEFDHCWITKFGYPNDEAWSAIPRTRGLTYGLYEVHESEWKKELARLNRHGFPETPELENRHFMILFHDSSFECIASNFSLSISKEKRGALLSRLTTRLNLD